MWIVFLLVHYTLRRALLFTIAIRLVSEESVPQELSKCENLGLFRDRTCLDCDIREGMMSENNNN